MIAFDMNVIERGVRGIFAREFITRQRKAKYPLFCTIVDSDKKEEKYNAISTLPTLSEMKDERKLAGFSEYTYTITNKVYATGIRVPRTLFEFDQTGQLRTLVQSLGARVANFPDKLIWALIASNDTCYDGSKFFSTTHDLGNHVEQSNIVEGLLTNSLLSASTKEDRDNAIAAAQISVNKAIARMAEFEDDRGEPWHDDIEPESLIILCHPEARFFIRSAVEAAQINATGNLMLKQVGKVLAINRPEIFKDSGGTVRKGTFYLLKVDTPIQPFIFQRFGPKVNFPDVIPEEDKAALQALQAVEVQTIMRTGSDIDAMTFFNDEFFFGARVIYSAGFGMWQNAVRVDANDAE